MVETVYTGNLHHLPLRMLKVFLVIADSLNLYFFLRQATSSVHKLVAPLPL